MEVMDHIKYSTKTTRTDGTRVDTIVWTIPDIVEVFNIYNELITNETGEKDNTNQDFINSGLNLKIRFFNENIIEIYYCSTNPVFLNCSLTIYSIRRGHLKEHNSIIEKDHTIQANEWNNLATTIGKFPDTINFNEGDDLRLHFEFTIFERITVDPSVVPEAQFNKDLEYLLNNGLFSDVIMKSVDGNEFKVHKAMLASRSAVLKAHFEHKTTEFYTNVVECHLESEILREVLTFIYCDKAPRVDENPEKLLEAAEYYQLSRLKSLCEGALVKKLTVENAMGILLLADQNRAKMLKQLVLYFIKNKAKLVTETDGWAQIKCAELIKRVFETKLADDIDTTGEILFLRSLKI